MDNHIDIIKIKLPTFLRHTASPATYHLTRPARTEHIAVQPLSEIRLGKTLQRPFLADFYSIYYVQKGLTKKVHQATSVHMEDGELYFTKPGEVKQWRAMQAKKGYLVTFTADYVLSLFGYYAVQNILDGLFNNHRKISLRLLQQDLISPLFKNLLQEHTLARPYAKELMKIKLLEILIHISRIKGGQMSPKTTLKFGRSSERLCTQFFHLLSLNHEQVLSGASSNLLQVKDYAKALNVNPSYLSACIREVSGQSAKKHLNEQLLIIAKCQLVHTQQSIANISFRLGFESPSYFTRFFKKQVGITPVAFREHQQLL